MFNVGDHVTVDGRKVGQPRRSGLVTRVSGPMVTVRWDDGHESTFVPTSGTMAVVDPSGRQLGR